MNSRLAVSVNGKILSPEKAGLPISNHSYRYGDGLFETMRWDNGVIARENFHFERLWQSLAFLNYQVPDLFTPSSLKADIDKLCIYNKVGKLARIRLSISRGEGGLFDGNEQLQYAIECWPIDPILEGLNSNGLVIGVYPGAQKSCDRLSNLKTANFLIYALAALYARKQGFNDCLVLNTHGFIADASTANIFLLQGGQWITPALDQGCIDGVMRRSVLEQFGSLGISCSQKHVSLDDLNTAQEIFLTNSVRGIRWVGQYGDRVYRNSEVVSLYSRLQ